MRQRLQRNPERQGLTTDSRGEKKALGQLQTIPGNTVTRSGTTGLATGSRLGGLRIAEAGESRHKHYHFCTSGLQRGGGKGKSPQYPKWQARRMEPR